MRELAVQSANDTNTDNDRAEIQKEVEQLTKEITRISTDTEFNTRKLLDGSLAAEASNISDATNFTASVAAGSNLTANGTYTINYTGTAAVAPSSGSAGTPASTIVVEGDASLITGKTFTYEGGKWKEGSNEYADNAALKTALGVTSISGTPQEGAKIVVAGDGKVTVQNTTETTGTPATAGQDAKFEITSITGPNGEAVSASAFKVDLTAAGKAGLSAGAGSFTVNVNTDDNALTFHIGANSGQNTKLTVQDMSAQSLGVDAVDLTTQTNADAAITTIDNAINTVSAQRAALGAMQNRLEHTINNLGTSSENLSAAESQIRDVDMAEEMSNYTKNNILVQAATSMLAQANQQPQSVLGLLQG
jgi:flagellin